MDVLKWIVSGSFSFWNSMPTAVSLTLMILMVFLFCQLFLPGMKTDPAITIVPSLPFVGVGLQFALRSEKFLAACRKKYGDIFILHMGLRSMAVLCNNKYAPDFFRVKEDVFPYKKVMDKVYLTDSLSSPNLSQVELFGWARGHLAAIGTPGKVPYVLDRLETQGKELVQRIRSKPGCGIIPEVKQYIVNSAARILLGHPLNERAQKDTFHYVEVFDLIMRLTFFFPKAFLDLFFRPLLLWQKGKVVKVVLREIEEHHNDPERNISSLLRKGVDEGMKDIDLAHLVVSSFYANLPNASLSLISVIGDLLEHPAYWGKARDHAASLNWDLEALCKSEYLHAVIYESARLAANHLSLMRTPKDKDTKFMGYNVGSIDFLAVSGRFLQIDERTWDEPNKFFPERFLGEGKRQLGMVYNWGSGVHLCPGRGLSQLQMKVALVCMLKELEPNFDKCKVSAPNFAVQASVVEREVQFVSY